jgi:hypothetical protein
VVVTDSAYRRWRDQPFPASSVDDDLDELHKDLAYWDAMVADTIIPAIEHGARYNPGVLDLNHGLAGYREKAVTASQQAGPAEAALIAQYLAYADLLIVANAETSEAD